MIAGCCVAVRKRVMGIAVTKKEAGPVAGMIAALETEGAVKLGGAVSVAP